MIDKIDDKEAKYKHLKEVTLKTLNEVWFWIKIYQKTDATLKIGMKTYKYLKDNIAELTEKIDE